MSDRETLASLITEANAADPEHRSRGKVEPGRVSRVAVGC
jgi:hypothetical protein